MGILMPEAREQFLMLGGLRFHVREWGAASSPPLILLHGLASSSHMFDLIAPELAVDYHVIAPDQRGHGLSDKPDHGYDFESVAHDLDRLFDAYKLDQAAVFGHSWGAYTTLYYAATRPARVSRAGLIDGGIRVFSEIFPTWAEAETKMAPPEYIHRSVDDIQHMIEFEWLGAAFRPELMPLALSIFDISNPHEVHAHLSRANHMQIAYPLWDIRPVDFFARVRCPMLIINAVAPGETADAQIQALTRNALEANPQAEVVWMPDTIHDIPWQRPRELVRFMKQFLGEK